MKKTLFAAAALVAMVSCNKTLIETPDSEFGYLNFGISADTEMSVLTKGNEDYSSYLVTITNSSNAVVTGYDKVAYSSISGKAIKLPAGTYTIFVQNFEENNLYSDNRTNGAVRVEGSNSVELVAGGNQTVNVACSPVNTMVTVNYEDTFSAVFAEPSIVITNGTKPFTMTMGHDKTNAVYYNTTNDNVDVQIGKESMTLSVAQLTWELTATVGNKRQKYTGNFNAPAAYWTMMDFAAGDSGLITITITANDSITTSYTVSAEVDPTTGAVVEQE